MGLRLCFVCFIGFICCCCCCCNVFVHLACEMAWVLGATLRSSVAFTGASCTFIGLAAVFVLARVSTCDARFGSLIECSSLHTKLSDNIGPVSHVSAQNGTETGEEETVHSALLFILLVDFLLLLLLYLFISIQLRSVFCLCRALWLSLTGFIAPFCAVALLIHNAITFD